MSGLHTIVCVKVVPKPEEVSIVAETNTLDRTRARSEINPPDMSALEVALELKGRHGGRISLLSMGPPLFVPYLKMALAMGADDAYLLSDRAFAGADTLPTSYALAKGIERIGSFDLVLCGEESSDGATGQVPQGIAEWLDLPQITFASHLEVDATRRRLVGHRELKGGHEAIEVPLPSVASIKVGINEPRFMDMARKRWLDDSYSPTVWTARDLGLDETMLGLRGSATIVDAVRKAAVTERRREFVHGTPEEKAQALLERLRPLL